MRSIHLASAGVLALAAAPLAGAGVLFTYDDPTALNHEFKVFAPAGPGNPGTVEYDSTQTLRLRIDASEEMGGAIVEVDANLFFFEMTVGPVSQVGNALIGMTSGAFEFRTADTGALIIRGDFREGTLVTLFDAGSHQTARNEAGGSLEFTPGSALFDLLDSVGYTLPGIAAEGPSSAAWSLADINEEITPQSLVAYGDRGTQQQFFPTFDADAAFVGSFEVPAPGALALFGLGTLIAFRGRRR